MKKICSQLEHVFNLDNDCANRLVIPIVHAVHFFVLVVNFNQACPDVFIDYYNSLPRSIRGGENQVLWRKLMISCVISCCIKWSMSICNSRIMKHSKCLDMRNAHHKRTMELIADYFVLVSYCTCLTERLLTRTLSNHHVTERRYK